MEQFPGALGCISEDGSGGACANGTALAGVTAVTADGDRVYAVSPSLGTLAVLGVDPVDGGFEDRGCFSATARPGCTTIPALAGASDVAAGRFGEDVYVAARDSDAVLRFVRDGGGLAYESCVAAALAGCFPEPDLDAPTALAVAVAGPVWVVASDAVHWFSPELSSGACFRQTDYGGCGGGRRALDGPRDVAVTGDVALVASSGSNGVAVFRNGDQPAGAAGCITEGGSEGCTAGAGLGGAARIVAHADTAYVAAPGAGAVTSLRVPFNAGAPSRLASDAAPTAALATPPEHFIADAPSYAGSHVYAGGAGIAPFARDRSTGRLTPLARPAFGPAGAVADLAVSDDLESTAVYAAVPSTGAVVAFARNIRPSCGFGFAPPPLPFKIGPFPAEVPLYCFDANHDQLTYTVETPPTLGRILGFRGDFAIYQGPGSNVPPRTDTFVVRASDGAESTTRFVTVELSYAAEDRFPPRPPPEIAVLDSRARMDRRGRIALRVRCTTDGSPCAAALALRRGRRVGRTSATLKAGATRRLRVKLSKRVRRSVRRHRKGVLLTAVATARQGDGRTDRAARRVRVRAKRSP